MIDVTTTASRAALILAGGAGTRLWPLSTEDKPKQFLEIFGGESLIQQTFRRLTRLVSQEAIFVATSERYGALVRKQLSLPVENILLEPERRNTAPAIAICCFEMEKRLGETTVGIFPSDHAITSEDSFLEVVNLAFRSATENDLLMTIGIEPDEASTGFGYLELGDELAPGILKVNRFVEKPDRKKAEEFLASGRYLWNGGMFVWRSSVFRAALAHTSPEIARFADEFVSTAKPEKNRDTYAQMPSTSIDYALLEQATNVATVRGDFGWSDVGSWSAVAKLTNSSTSHVTASQSKNVFVHSDSKKPVIVAGVDDVAIVDTPEGLLILDLKRPELLSEAVKLSLSRRRE